MTQQAIDDTRRRRLLERGYAILHDVYTPEEIEQIREQA